MTLLIPRPIEKICDIESAYHALRAHQVEMEASVDRRQTHHRGNDSIVIFVQLATSGQPGSQAGGNEADSDKGEDDGDDCEIDTATVELIVSCVYDSHLANCVDDFSSLVGVPWVLEGGRCEHREVSSIKG